MNIKVINKCIVLEPMNSYQCIGSKMPVLVQIG